MSERILVRADASVDIGAGHALRCIALAEEWLKRGAGADWATVELPEWLSSRLEKAGIREHRLAVVPGSEEEGAATAELARELDVEWVVVDGYSFDETYLRALKERAACRILLMSDYPCAEDISADIVLNQNIGVALEDYPGISPGKILLLGPEYALLRSEFRQKPGVGARNSRGG